MSQEGLALSSGPATEGHWAWRLPSSPPGLLFSHLKRTDKLSQVPLQVTRPCKSSDTEVLVGLFKGHGPLCCDSPGKVLTLAPLTGPPAPHPTLGGWRAQPCHEVWSHGELWAPREKRILSLGANNEFVTTDWVLRDPG